MLARFPLALVLFTAACGSELDGTLYDGLTTSLDPSTVVAGNDATILCSVERGEKWLEPTDYAARLTPITGPEGGATVSALKANGTKKGTYLVQCEIPKYNAVDPVGAVLTVVPGEAVAVRPSFSRNPIEAGTFTSGECVEVDAFGNETAIANPTWTLPPGLEQSGLEFTSEAAGTYPVICADPARPNLTKTPVDLRVVPGPAVRVELFATPERTAYAPGAVVALDWNGYDRFDNAIRGLPGVLTAPTTPRITETSAAERKFRLEEEGIYTFSVRLDDPLSSLTDTLDLLVDITPPEIVLEFPPRGATLDATDGPVIARGRVIDPFGIGSVVIEGQPVVVGADGRFTHQLESKWGLNVLNIVARDRANNIAEKSPTYAYSDDWTSFVDQNAEGLQRPDGLVVLLGQNFFDDGVHDPAKLDDLATLFETLLSTIDLRSVLGSALSGVNQRTPIVDQTTRIDIIPNVSWANVTLRGDFVLTLEAAQTTGIARPWVGIDSRDGGIDFDITFGTDETPALAIDLVFRVALEFEVLSEGCSPFGCLPNAPGTAVGEVLVTSRLAMGDFDISMSVDMEKTFQSPMRLEIVELSSVFGDFDIQPIEDVTLNVVVQGIPGVPPQTFSFALSSVIDLGALTGGLINPIANAAGQILPALVNPLIADLVGPILSGLFDLLVIDTTLPIPNLLGGPTLDLGFYTELSTVDFTDDGGTVGLSAGLHSEFGIDLPSLGMEGDLHEENPLGAIVRNDCLGLSESELVWTWDPSIGIGVKTDVLNAAFFAAWWTGLLNAPLDLSALGGGGLPIPIDNLSIELEWLLPPMLNDCSKGPMRAQIGDLYVKLTGNALGFPIEVEMYTDLTIGVEFVSYDGGEGGPSGLSLRFGAITDSDVEVAYLDDGGLGSLFDVRVILESLPDLIGGFISGQEFGPFELPATDLSSIIPGVPAGTSLGLGNLQVKPIAGYAILGGDLE